MMIKRYNSPTYIIVIVSMIGLSCHSVNAWTSTYPNTAGLKKYASNIEGLHSAYSSSSPLYSSLKDSETIQKQESTLSSAEETTEKYGLEAGLFESLKSNDSTSAKALLTKYGIAYLATSIPLAIVSFALCYLLVNSGVDVVALLDKIGIEAKSGDTSDQLGTAAIAYTAHKALSPVRFPPTVALTPFVAKLIGKEPVEDSESV